MMGPAQSEQFKGRQRFVVITVVDTMKIKADL